MFLPKPRTMNEYPISSYSDRVVRNNPCSVLNCSFRITSRGFVNAAPAIPAADDLIADLHRLSRSYVSESKLGFGNDFSIKSFMAIAVQYFGTVFKTPAVVPCHNPDTPCILYMCWTDFHTFGI